jgi:D-xylose transport system substrate-binding protein
MRKIHLSLLCLVAFVTVLSGCVSGNGPEGNSGTATVRKTKGPNEPVHIGFSMDTLKEERWQRDKQLVEQRAKEVGAQLSVLVANGDDNVQVKQAENLLTQGVDVLIVAPHNGEVAASIVEMAKRQGVPVISYDRLIRSSDVDLYVSHQVVKIGEMQAKYLLDRAPKGNYVVVQGSETDNNARLLHDGQMNILKPAVDRGDIKIIADQPAKEWQQSAALNIVENALTQAKNDIVAVVASNDGTARGAVQALEGQNLAGKVLVSGQDADLPSLQLIVLGKQTMTVYKPIQPLAFAAVDSALKLARGQQVEAKDTVDNGFKKVPSILLEPVAVDKDNLLTTVVADGYQTVDKICAGIPADKCPPSEASKVATR